MSYYYKSYYYNRYNKQRVNDDNNVRTSTGYNLLGKWRNSNIHTNSGFSYSHIPYSVGYSFTFFFERRQHHYEVINDLIFSQIISIKNIYDKSNLFDFLQLNSLGKLNGVVYEDAKRHLKNHKRYLPQRIEEILPDIHNHNLEVIELERIINDFIASSYISHPYNSIFPYHFTTHINSQSLKIWFDSIQNIREEINITNIKKNIDTEILRSIIRHSGIHNHIFNINSHQIGEGNYKDSAYDIEKIFINLLKNDVILQRLVYLVNKNIILNKDVDEIVNDVNSISESIKMGYYDKKLSCCPKLLKVPGRR